MLLKEYRILLPFSMEEYRMGQLYLTARSSRGYSKDGEGIEVIVNEPFENDEIGKGQYTKKIFHLSGLIPSWVRFLFPSLNNLVVIEESWNAFPYCKTIFNCEYFGEKFHIEVVSMHKDNDLGTTENIHNLSKEDLKIREIDFIDIVNDPIPEKKYSKSEDPALFKSTQTGRGPLTKDWKANTKPIACAYKTVRVKFNAWMIGHRIERGIQDHGFREIFLEVNRQCFCWMDEWIGMSLDDMRQFEAKCAREQRDAVNAAAAQNGTEINNNNNKRQNDEKNENPSDGAQSEQPMSSSTAKTAVVATDENGNELYPKHRMRAQSESTMSMTNDSRMMSSFNVNDEEGTDMSCYGANDDNNTDFPTINGQRPQSNANVRQVNDSINEYVSQYEQTKNQQNQ